MLEGEMKVDVKYFSLLLIYPRFPFIHSPVPLGIVDKKHLKYLKKGAEKVFSGFKHIPGQCFLKSLKLC